MFKANVAVLALGLWSASAWAQAQEPGLAQINVNGRSVPAVTLAVIQLPAVSMDEAALTIAPVLQRHTQDTGHEACAMLCKSSKGWAALPLSVGAHTSCPIVRQCPNSSTSSGVSIHSHRRAGPYRANLADMRMLGVSHAVGIYAKADRPERFSEEDFQSPGYMVTPNGEVWFQAGPSNVRRVTPNP